jgi:hypothetical protein
MFPKTNLKGGRGNFLLELYLTPLKLINIIVPSLLRSLVQQKIDPHKYHLHDLYHPTSRLIVSSSSASPPSPASH